MREARLNQLVRKILGIVAASVLCAATAPLQHLAPSPAASAQPGLVSGPSQSDVSRDVDALCQIVRTRYAYYASRQRVWNQTCKTARQQALDILAETPGGHLALIETMLDQLWDNHVSLNTNSSVSPRLVPSGSDYRLDFQNGKAIVTAVRPGSGAAAAGLTVGDVVTAINGEPVLTAAMKRMSYGRRRVSQARLNWAINAQAAGYRGTPRSASVRRGREIIELAFGDPEPVRSDDLVTSRLLPGSIGYIRFEDSLGDTATVEAFDAALERLKGARRWVIDLRNTPGGGNTDVAEPILGRFIRGVKRYQLAGPRWEGEPVRRVASRGPWRVKGRVAILAGRWTGSMGEGMAIGFDGLKRGRVYGSPMAGLAGGIDMFDLPASGYGVRLPAYNLKHVKGMDRHHWRPPYEVTADNGNGVDLALQAALNWLR